MSVIDTNTKLVLPAEAQAAINEGRIPQWQAPLNTHRTHVAGKHRLNEDDQTQRIPAERLAALRERVMSVPVVSAPVHVPEPVRASSSRAKLAMVAANMRRWVRR